VNDKSINPMFFKISYLPDNFFIFYRIIPEPERHYGEFMKRVYKIFGNILSYNDTGYTNIKKNK
jgi:hypothetical protein